MATNSAILAESAGLLGPDDPPPYHVLNPGGSSHAVLICDHASNRIPKALGDLGLEPANRGRHIAYDIGAAAVTEILSARLDAVALFCSYSRLVIDPNRPTGDLTSIREISDGTIVPGNRGLSAEDKDARTKEIFQPYHRSIAAVLGERRREGVPALISVHSFTHFMAGRERPWHIGVLANRDRRIADPLLAWWRDRTQAHLGDNKPYSGMDPYGYSIETHALPAGLPNVLLEIRQDLIRDEAGQAHWADVIGDGLQAVLARPETRTLFG